MSEKLSPFNPVDYLQGEDEIAEFLAEVRLDENPVVLAIALGHVAKHENAAAPSLYLSDKDD